MKFILLALSLAFSTTVSAWQPAKPVTAIIGFGPGSGNEQAFRIVSAQIERTNPGISFVVQNMPGAGGVTSVNHSYVLPPNGLSLNVTSTVGVYANNEVFTPDVAKYNIDDLYPIMNLASSPMAVVASNASSVKNVTELVAYLKNPKQNVSIGLGSTVPLVLYGMIMDFGQGNTKMVNGVMYKGPNQAITDVAGGHIEFAILPVSVAVPLVEANKVKLVGLAGKQRLKKFPNTQTVNEVLPGAVMNAEWGLTLPKGTSQEIVEWYVKTFTTAIKSPEVQKQFDDNYMVASTELAPAQVQKHIGKLREELLPISRKIKIKLMN